MTQAPLRSWMEISEGAAMIVVGMWLLGEGGFMRGLFDIQDFEMGREREKRERGEKIYGEIPH